MVFITIMLRIGTAVTGIAMLGALVSMILETWTKQKLKKEYAEGVSCKLISKEEVIELLSGLPCAFVEKVYCNKEDNVEIDTKWGGHTVDLKEKKIILDAPVKNWNTMENDVLVERNTLYKYIENALKKEKTENIEEYYHKWKNYILLYKWIRRVCIGIFLLWATILFCSLCRRSA